MLLLALPAGLKAQFLYTTNSGTITITGYTGSSGSVTIPGSITGRPVTAIGDYAFESRTNLTSVTISGSVTSIGDFAFFGCSGLTGIAIPASVTSIGERALGQCSKLAAIKVDPNNQFYTNSPGGALYDKNMNTLIQCPGGATGRWATLDTCTAIADYAFDNCAGITNFTISASVSYIGNFAFFSCSKLAAIIVDSNNEFYASSSGGALYDKEKTVLFQCPGGATGSWSTLDSCTDIAHFAFAYCRGLTKISITAGVLSIGERALSGCDSLTNITVNELNQNYRSADGVLFDSSQTRLIQFPGGKTGYYTVPDYVTDLGYAAFYQCHLTGVSIGSNVMSIDPYSLAWGYNLRNITVSANNPRYSSVAGVLFDQGQTTLLQCPAAWSGSYKVPGGISIIGPAAFLGCTKLTSITIPARVYYLDQFAFKYCSGLTAAYFQGDAPFAIMAPSEPPFVGTTVFYGSDLAIVYYLPGTTGWGTSFGGRPTTANRMVDATRPVVTITAPAPNLRTSNAVFTVRGTASDNWILSGVYYSLNGGAWSSPATADDWDNWSADVTLTPGTNTLDAYALDAAGNRSLTNRQAMVYVVVAPISLNLVGKGTINGATNGQLVEIGKNVNLTATPGTGYLLTNWLVQVDGATVLSTNRAVPFVMRSNLVLTAKFVDVLRPANTITAPIANQRVSNDVFTVTGSVKDNGPVATVRCQLNSGEWIDAVSANGWTNWTASVGLTNAGTNTLRAYAEDAAGNRSATNKVSFVCVLPQAGAPLRFELLGPSQGVSNGWFRLRIVGSPGTTAVVESSPDLVRWERIKTNTVSPEGFLWWVPVNQQPAQFFRARTQ